jgi:hypothetical protein
MLAVGQVISGIHRWGMAEHGTGLRRDLLMLMAGFQRAGPCWRFVGSASTVPWSQNYWGGSVAGWWRLTSARSAELSEPARKMIVDGLGAVLANSRP